MTKRDMIGFSSGMTVLIAMSLIVFNIAWRISDKKGGAQLQAELIPFHNAHIMEEAFEGTYRPWRDAPFIALTIPLLFLPFFTATIIALRMAGQRIAVMVATIGLFIQTALRYAIFSSNYPWSLRAAFLFELTVAAIGVLCAIKLCGGNSEMKRTV